MGARKTTGMRFVCDQRWEDMEPRGKDRFCTACSQPVIDFTQMRQEDIRAHFAQDPYTCGQFRLEQVDPLSMPLDELTQGVRRGLAVTLSVLALEAAQAQNVSHPVQGTEQTAPASAAPEMIGTEIPVSGLSPLPMPVIAEAEAAKARNTHRWFVSLRFPFIHRRARHVRGKRMIGRLMY